MQVSPTIPLNQIVAGLNPRTYFDQTEMTELISSVRSVGIIQPITVRPYGDKFQIIAGERRFRAACEVFGLEGVIPAVVKEADDELVDKLSLIENIQRSAMSPTEEAVAAGKVLERSNGDRKEAAKVLGWPESKLTRRLALLNLCSSVMVALNERKIQLGHAELLASIEQGKQADALDKIIQHNLTVDFVKNNLIKKSSDMAKAIFDKAGCSACQFNGEVQSTLFADNVGAGKCTNGSCYAQKTAERVEQIRVELTEEVPASRIINVGDSGFVKLAADGALGVGDEQFEACRACQHYGATVSAVPGSEGQIERDICFDISCHQKKVIEGQRIAAEKAKAEKSAPTTTGTAPKEKKAKATNTAAKVDVPTKVKEFRRKVWNAAAQAEFMAQPVKAMSYILDLMVSGDMRHISSSTMRDAAKQISGSEFSHSGNVTGIAALDRDAKSKLFCTAASSAVTGIEENRLKGVMAFLEIDLAKYFTINAEYLALLTKSEIEVLCAEIGIESSIPDFKKVIGGKKDEVIKSILAAPFSFDGILPSALRYTEAKVETIATP